MIEVDVIAVRNFLIAILIGALVGIEREKHKATEHPVSFGGQSQDSLPLTTPIHRSGR